MPNLRRNSFIFLVAAVVIALAIALPVVLLNRSPTADGPSDPAGLSSESSSEPLFPELSPEDGPSPSPQPQQSRFTPTVAPPATTPSPVPSILLESQDPHFISSPHVAHAVPGRPYVVDDVNSDGFEEVALDASRSHSHFFQSSPAPKLAAIQQWLWYDNDGGFLANSSTPVLPFQIGTSQVVLTVIDDFGNNHSDKTNVTVNPGQVPGVFCYFYNHPSGSDDFTIDENYVAGLKPLDAVLYENVSLRNTSQLPSRIAILPRVQLRCAMRLASTGNKQTRFLTADYSGTMRVFWRAKSQSAFDSTTAMSSKSSQSPGKSRETVELTVPADEDLLVELWYLQPADNSFNLHIRDGIDGALHDLPSQLPIIHSLTPGNSTLEGGGLLTIYGLGLWRDPYVYFDGASPTKPIGERSDHKKLTVSVPLSDVEATVEVNIGNQLGGSNALPFKYATDALPPIKFDERHLVDKKTGEPLQISRITNVKFGPDHRLYMASLDSFVYTLAIDRELAVSDVCVSPSLGEGRTVIGLAFNPASTATVLYASSSHIFWSTSEPPLEGDFPWANGKIHKLAPGHGGECLGVVGEPVISGLPVSDHDHAVYGMLFDDDGNLLFQVGSATNAGVPDSSVGAIDESPLSAACLIANVNSPTFNGTILYDSTNPVEANVTNGDVQVYAPGWRSSFELTLHSNGFIYATDNGANSEFGNRSLDCSGRDAPVSPYQTDDRIGKVVRGKYAGHANRNRGRFDPAECRWRGPFNEATDTYLPPLGLVESSTDGIIEYTADLFGGQLKGNLFASKYSSNDENDEGRVYRIRLDSKGDIRGSVDALWEASGLSVVMTPWGDLITPRIFGDTILSLKAVYDEKPSDKGRLIAVSPFRGPLGGGNKVLVTGFGFGEGASALFDGKECQSVETIDADSFLCEVPSATDGGRSVAVSIVLADGSVVASSGGADYRYMRI